MGLPHDGLTVFSVPKKQPRAQSHILTKQALPYGHGNPSELAPIPSISLGGCLTLRSGTQMLLNVCRHQRAVVNSPACKYFCPGSWWVQAGSG